MRIKVRVLVMVLVCALVLAVAGAGSWFYLHRDTGPSEPMCLVLTRQDVRPLVGLLDVEQGVLRGKLVTAVKLSEAVQKSVVDKLDPG